MKIEIKNRYVLGLASWLNELQLSGKLSRTRTRFVNKLAERHKETDKFRIELVDKYAKKDKNGKNVMDGENVVLADVEAFSKEINELYDEVFTVGSEKEAYGLLKHIVLDTDYVFGPAKDADGPERLAKLRQAEDYTEWCAVFEN